ncbi:MAG: hypothetical protein F6J93_21945 [Oscillatoria sp. SIO1A7]|nr:hypothetical protein [Oscillatoria sp. SIO1A7]
MYEDGQKGAVFSPPHFDSKLVSGLRLDVATIRAIVPKLSRSDRLC